MRVYQIYFDESQVGQLEPDYVPYFNKKCTKYFESQVIHDLVMQGRHLRTDYFGVVSYKLRQKLGYMKDGWKDTPNIANHSIETFTPEQFEAEVQKHKPDVMSFQRHASHDPILVADGFHPNFRKYWEYIMQKIGYDWKPTVFETVLYCNYFVAKPEIYERYVREMLSPAMEVMEGMPELDGNSYYPRALPDNLKKEFGLEHYPYHAFITERMPSYFAHIHNLDCKNY